MIALASLIIILFVLPFILCDRQDPPTYDAVQEYMDDPAVYLIEEEQDRKLNRDIKKRREESDWVTDPLYKTSRRNCGRKPRGKTLRDKGAQKHGRRYHFKEGGDR